MKAATYSKYGPPDVVSISDILRPEPKDNEVLIRVHASTVSSGDWRLRTLVVPRGMGLAIRLFAGPFGPRQRVLGTEVAGTIAGKGASVTNWNTGDEVIAYAGAQMGGHAEYMTMPADGILAPKPLRLSFAEAAAIPFGGLTALEFLRDKGRVQAGEKILVVGASGATGSAAVQLGRHFGAHVTGVCSGGNAELVKNLGAHRIIDYRREDFATRSERYDMIVDTTGTAPFKRVRHLLTARGRLVVISGALPDMLRSIFEKRIVGGVSSGSVKGLKYLLELVKKGEFFPLIDRVYPFEHIVKAHAHVDTGRKKGAVVLSLVPDASRSLAEKEPLMSISSRTQSRKILNAKEIIK